MVNDNLNIPSSWKMNFVWFLLAEFILGAVTLYNHVLGIAFLFAMMAIAGFIYALYLMPSFWIYLMIISSGLDYWGVLFGGITLFHVSYVLGVFSIASYLLFNPEFKFRIYTPINKYVYTYIGVAALSLIYSPNLESGAFFIVITTALFLMYLGIVNFITTKTHYIISFLILAGLNLFISLLTMYQIMYENVLYIGKATVTSSTGDKIWRASGTFDDPNVTASFLIVGLIIAIGILIFAKINKLTKIILGIVSLITVAGVIVTFSRSGWLALIIGIFVLFMFFKRKVLVLIPITIVSVIIILVILVTPYSDFVISRFVSIFDVFKDPSILTRIGMGLSGLEMFKDSPVFGMGYRSYPVLYDYYINPITPNFLLHVKEPHTLYITLLAENGIIGLSVVVVWFYKVYKDTLKAIRRIDDNFLKAFLIGNFAVFISFVGNYFFYGNLFPDFNLIWINLGFIYSVIIFHTKKEEYVEQVQQVS